MIPPGQLWQYSKGIALDAGDGGGDDGDDEEGTLLRRLCTKCSRNAA
jgi:hypothetical protein